MGIVDAKAKRSHSFARSPGRNPFVRIVGKLELGARDDEGAGDPS